MELPQGWKELSSDDRSSTITYFIGGWADEEGDEILIWHGSEHDGEVELTSHLGNEVPDGAEYLIEVHVDGELEEELFARKSGEAWNRAKQKLIVMTDQA